MEEPTTGGIAWRDLTVADAPAVRDFYEQVVGWQPSPVDMGEYADFNMLDAAGVPTAGICHARGVNAGLPAQWLVYILVADLDASMAACRDGGGEVVAGPKTMAGDRYCVIRDPAGAVCALYQKGAGGGAA